MTGYKLFEQDIRTGKLYPLFIDKKNETPVREWIKAENIPPENHKGFAHRAGWHIGTHVPSAPWLMSSDGTYKSQRGKHFKRVWCRVSYSGNDVTEQALKQPKKCFDVCPENSYYNFRESQGRLWVITDKIFVHRILSENERQEIMKKAGYDEFEAFKPYAESFKKRAEKGGKKS